MVTQEELSKAEAQRLIERKIAGKKIILAEDILRNKGFNPRIVKSEYRRLISIPSTRREIGRAAARKIETRSLGFKSEQERIRGERFQEQTGLQVAKSVTTYTPIPPTIINVTTQPKLVSTQTTPLPQDISKSTFKEGSVSDKVSDRGILTTILREAGTLAGKAERGKLEVSQRFSLFPTINTQLLKSSVGKAFKEAKVKSVEQGIQVAPFVIVGALAPPVAGGLLGIKAYEDIFTKGGKEERRERAEFIAQKITGEDLSIPRQAVIPALSTQLAQIPETLELVGATTGLSSQLVRFPKVTRIEFIGFKAQTSQGKIQTDVIFRTETGQRGFATGRTQILDKTDDFIISKTTVVGKKVGGLRFAGKEDALTEVINFKNFKILKQVSGGKVGFVDIGSRSVKSFTSTDVGVVIKDFTGSGGITRVPSVSTKILSESIIKDITISQGDDLLSGIFSPAKITKTPFSSTFGTGGQVGSPTQLTSTLAQQSTESIIRSAITLPTETTLPLQIGSLGVTVTQQDLSQTLNKQNQKITQTPKVIQSPAIINVIRTNTIQLPRITTSPAQIPRQTITPITLSRSIQTQQLPQQFIPTSFIPLDIKTNIPKIPSTFKLPKILKPQKKSGKFPAFLRRFGSFKLVGYGRTPRQAVTIGKRAATQTLGATFKVPSFKGLKVAGFRTKKTKEGVLFIEPKKKRLKRGTLEIPEIQAYKRRKGKKSKRKMKRGK